MRVGIVGAGAVGALIGARLARAGHAVSVLARGATGAAIAAGGLRVIERAGSAGEGDRAGQGGQAEGGRGSPGEVGPGRAGDGLAWSVPVAAVSDEPAALGVQELLVIAVKAPAMRSVATAVGPMIGSSTVVLPAMNGVPWWFFEHAAAGLAGWRLRAVDPDGAIAAAIPAARVLGAVVHWSSACPQPGLVRCGAGRRLIVGEPAGGASARAARIVQVLADAGFEAQASDDIRREVWFKLWGNLTVNPVSAITGATADRILADPLVVALCVACMDEAAAVGARIGCPVTQSARERLEVARGLGAFRTSMLQDVDAGRPVELDALVEAVREIAARVGVPTASIDTLTGLARLHARVRGLYPDHPDAPAA